MKYIIGYFLTFLLLSSLAFADQPQGAKPIGEPQLYQIYFFDPKVGKDFILLEKMMVQDSKFYVSTDWAIRQFGFNEDITDTNTLLISRARPAARTSRTTKDPPWEKHELSMMIEGNVFTDFIPAASRNPLQSYVGLEAFTQATGSTYAFNSKTQVIHIRVERRDGQDGSVEKKPSTCHEWVRGFAESPDEYTLFSLGKGSELAQLRPMCNDHDEMVSEVSGKAIVFFGPPCQGGVMRVLTEEIKAWQKDVAGLRQRYAVVDDGKCPCCIP